MWSKLTNGLYRAIVWLMVLVRPGRAIEAATALALCLVLAGCGDRERTPERSIDIGQRVLIPHRPLGRDAPFEPALVSTPAVGCLEGMVVEVNDQRVIVRPDVPHSLRAHAHDRAARPEEVLRLPVPDAPRVLVGAWVCVQSEGVMGEPAWDPAEVVAVAGRRITLDRRVTPADVSPEIVVDRPQVVVLPRAWANDIKEEWARRQRARY